MDPLTADLRLAAAGDPPLDPDRVVLDLVAVTLLSVDVPGRAGLEILDRQRRRYEVLLEEIGPIVMPMKAVAVSAESGVKWNPVRVLAPEQVGLLDHQIEDWE
jgi:hypothetical protein